MKILNDLYLEINRLFIAGSKFAPSDMRISRLLPQLQSIGEKSPVIKRLADMTNDMLKSPTPEIALPDLGVFLLAIMNTQGNINIDLEEQKEHIPFFKELPITTVSYSLLEPTITALTKTGNARYEIVKNAFDSNNINDFRLYSPLAKALDDKYSELVDLVKTIIKSIGKQMIPFLLRDLNIKSKKKSDGARMELLDALNYENIIPLAEQALQEGSTITKVEALKILGREMANEKLLLTYADDKKAAIKEAALIGLVRMDSQKGYEKFLHILQSQHFAPAIQAITYCKNDNYIQDITDILLPKFEKFEAKKKTAEDIQNLHFICKAIYEMGELYSHEAAVKIYEGIFSIQFLSIDYPGYNLADYYFGQAKHVYTPERLCDVFVNYYAANYKRLFNYECMEIILESTKRDIALDYLKKFFMRKQCSIFMYFRAANLLARYMNGKHLFFVAKGIYDELFRNHNNYDSIYNSTQYIFNYPELVNKIFNESGHYDLLEKLKAHYADSKNYYREFADLLQKY